MGLKRLNPFAPLPNGREVWAWGMYDLANQSFQLLVNTLLFGIFIAEVVAADAKNPKALFSYMVAAALLVVVVLSPGLGAWADARGFRKRLLIGTGVGAVVLTAGLTLLGPGMLGLAAGLYITAAVLVGLGENFLGSFLPFLSTPKTVGRISALGWAMSYVGAVGLLAITAVAVFILGMEEPRQWRWLFLLGAVWFGLGILPAAFLLREPPADVQGPDAESAEGGGGAGAARGVAGFFIESFRRLRGTVREAWKYRQLVRFLAVFFVYSLGTNTVVYFLGVIGSELNFAIRQLILLALVIAVTAGGGAVIAGRIQDRVGHRRTVGLFLVLWVLSTGAMALSVMLKAGGGWFWPVAAGLGVALGGIGTSSRAVVGAFTPREKSAEFFGLWGMAYKLAGIVGPVTFAALAAPLGQAGSLFLLAGFFAAGLLVLPFVDEAEGVRRATEGAGSGTA